MQYTAHGHKFPLFAGKGLRLGGEPKESRLLPDETPPDDMSGLFALASDDSAASVRKEGGDAAPARTEGDDAALGFQRADQAAADREALLERRRADKAATRPPDQPFWEQLIPALEPGRIDDDTMAKLVDSNNFVKHIDAMEADLHKYTSAAGSWPSIMEDGPYTECAKAEVEKYLIYAQSAHSMLTHASDRARRLVPLDWDSEIAVAENHLRDVRSAWSKLHKSVLPFLPEQYRAGGAYG